jgi:hypothetical protein
MAKTRIRRKDLKRPDEFVTLSARAIVKLREHGRAVAWAGGAAILLLTGVGGAMALRSAKLRDANADLGRAMATLRGGAGSEAAVELAKVSERWGSTPVAKLAELLEAHEQLRLGSPQTTIELLQGLEVHAAELPPFLQQQMLCAWGAALETQKDWTGAASRYRQAASRGGPYTATAIVGEARVLELSGDKAAAAELYRKAYNEFPELPSRQRIASKVGS